MRTGITISEWHQQSKLNNDELTIAENFVDPFHQIRLEIHGHNSVGKKTLAQKIFDDKDKLDILPRNLEVVRLEKARKYNARLNHGRIIFILADMTSSASLAVERYLKRIEPSDKPTTIFLVGNKIDADMDVTPYSLIGIGETLDFDKTVFISAQTGENIDLLLLTAIDDFQKKVVVNTLKREMKDYLANERYYLSEDETELLTKIDALTDAIEPAKDNTTLVNLLKEIKTLAEKNKEMIPQPSTFTFFTSSNMLERFIRSFPEEKYHIEETDTQKYTF